MRHLVASALCALSLTWGYSQAYSPETTPVATSQFAHPWSAVCKVTVSLSRTLGNGGSGTLIGVTDDAALVLTVAHVAERKGLQAVCQFGDEKVPGYVLAVHPSADLALLLVKRPAGIKPVPVASATPTSGPFYLAGFPGYDRDTLRFQKGEYVDHDNDTLTVGARPEKGMSGGATFDRYGRVVGAVSAYGVRYGYAGDGAALRELVSPYLK